jgi:hypothetical protein
MGDDANGQYMGGENGVQISDSGSSKGFNAVNKPTTTLNIEGYNNVFANAFRPVWIDSSGRGVGNVYLHDNKFLSGSEIETFGIPVREISYTNPPTKEMSEKIFSNIFDLFNVDLYSQAGENDTVILPDGITECPSKALGTIEYQTIGNNTTTLVKIPPDTLKGVSEVRYEVDGKRAVHTLMIGERTSQGIVFMETNIWEGDFSHEGSSLKLHGKVDTDKINITCVTPTGEFIPIMNTTTVEFKTVKFHPAAIIIILSFLIAYLFFRFSIKHLA